MGLLLERCAEVSMAEIYLRGSVPFANDSQRWFSEDPDGLRWDGYRQKRDALRLRFAGSGSLVFPSARSVETPYTLAVPQK